ncbi:MAG: hypothetical protein WBA57_26245 [Elainellaceae cyanobacterium]
MHVKSTQWSVAEKKIVENAFSQAHQRESEALLQLVQRAAEAIATLEDAWQLNDFLSSKRHEIDGKYDDQPAMLLFTLAALVREGWLSLQELNGLDSEKLRRISALTRM